ncbi:hypothetical protein B0H19DRAFT_1331340 [Mycena capillaripes]|nr:hypothetical protein B0H19DRAFT_1331340 [Mycena capillaripes]
MLSSRLEAPSFVAMLDYPSDFHLGSEFALERGRLQSPYVETGGGLLTVRVVGVVAEVAELVENIVVLVCPGHEYPVARSLFAKQFQVLQRVLSRDRELPGSSRTVANVMAWVEGETDRPFDGIVYLRIQIADGVVRNLDASTCVALDEISRSLGDEAPILRGFFDVLEPGALVMCNVEPFRADWSLDTNTFDRMYGLISVATSRLFRSG